MSARRGAAGHSWAAVAGAAVVALATLVLAAANTKKYEELARSQVCDTTARALPALSNGMLYVRDTKALKCVDLR